MEHWASFAVMNLAIILSMHIIQDKKINLKKLYWFYPSLYQKTGKCIYYILLVYLVL